MSKVTLLCGDYMNWTSINSDVLSALKNYKPIDTIIFLERYGKGHINSTYRVVCFENEVESEYILQGISPVVFDNPINDYADISEDGWYFEAVSYVVNTGIMKGYESGLFGTSDSIQRQDFLVMLARYAGVDLTDYEGTESRFSDVAADSYYEAAVNWGSEHGIVNGYDDGRFGVGDTITREQMVTFLCRYARYIGLDTSVDEGRADAICEQYEDIESVSEFALESVLWAVDRGVISGKTPTTIAPQGNAQRCEVAKVILNIDQNEIF